MMNGQNQFRYRIALHQGSAHQGLVIPLKSNGQLRLYLLKPLGAVFPLDNAQPDGRIAGYEFRCSIPIHSYGRPQDGVPELSLQQCEAQIVRLDRCALDPADKNEVAWCPLIHEPEQVLKRTESAMHSR